MIKFWKVKGQGRWGGMCSIECPSSLGFVFYVFFYVSLGLVLVVFVVLGLVSSVLSQEIGWEERLQNDLFLSSGT